MNRPDWTYRGRIDCFGVPAKQRDNILRLAIEQIHQAGGQLQIRRLRNQYDTDRYQLQADLRDARPLEHMLRHLAAMMPPDHPEQVLEGYDRGNLQREDLVLQAGRLLRRPYAWAPEGERVVR